VAIPALLLHAILSAQARGITSRMEAAGLSFINEFLKRGATQGT
jgi:biopolymer transport protein ExbB/TolQ